MKSGEWIVRVVDRKTTKNQERNRMKNNIHLEPT
jgi:hypothetical protein